MSCSAILSSTSQPYNVTSIVISGTITSQPESREIIPRATPVTSHTSSSYYSCIEPSPPQPNNTPQLQGESTSYKHEQKVEKNNT